MEKRLTMFLACLFLSLGLALAQTKVSGTVISQDDNEPVIGGQFLPARTPCVSLMWVWNLLKSVHAPTCASC